MVSNFSKKEQHVHDCLELNDNEILEYIKVNKLTTEETKSLLEKVGIPSAEIGDGQMKKRLSKQTTPIFKKKHAGVYNHYLSILKANPNFDPKAVTSIHDSILGTRLRMDLRAPFHRSNAYGLVLGRIQSGKTAHLIGTVLHAIDSEQTTMPYDTVIILSGLIDDLRIQTRDRFEKVLSSYAGGKVELIPERDSDLNGSNNNSNEVFRRHLKVNGHASRILVVKKNHKILENILEILEEKPLYKKKKFLIIDDEADHASMDTNAESYEVEGDVIDENPSLTNQLLRKIILNLSDTERCWYIGYTATPYANLLMSASRDDVESEFGLPLFPRDFFHALPKPDGHLDNEFYFSTPSGHNHVVLKSSPESDTEEEDELVRELLHRHLLTQIIKDIKGLEIHHTTLVHTDVGVGEHHRYVENFNNQLNGMRTDKDPNSIVEFLSILLHDYSLSLTLKTKVESKLKYLKLNWSDIMLELRKIKIVEVNRRPQSTDEISSQDLNYSSGMYKRSYIAVGGTRLSRGLTLEGLTTTWFTRAAQTPVYDTMLQMARWCGYRAKYDELVKIFTTSDIRDFYQHITMVEKEIRYQIEILPPDADPLDTLIWIKEHSGMEVTAKMPATYDRNTWGEVSHPHFWSYESPYFGDEPGSTAKSLFSDFERLITKIGGISKINLKPLNGNGSFKLRMNVRNNKVQQFLEKYLEAYPKKENSLTFNRLKQILGQWDKGYSWNIAIHTPSSALVSERIMVRGIDIGLVQRKTEVERPTRFSIIQTSNENTTVDLSLGEQRKSPLLLLYLINPNSKKGLGGIHRVFDSSVSTPVIGVGIILPDELIGDGGSMVAREKGV